MTLDFQQIANFKNEGGVNEDVRKAEADFRYLCSQSNFFISSNLGLLSLTKSGTKHGDVLCIPFKTSDKVIRIPKSKIKLDDPQMYVAVVCYIDGKPVDVLLINSAKFAESMEVKLFNFSKLISYDKKVEQFEVHIKNLNDAAVQKFAFSEVFGHLQG